MKSYKQNAKTVRDKYPFYKWACENISGYKTRAGNVAFRKRCLELAAEKEDYARQLWIMCSRDMLFFINTFCFTFDPRLVPKSTVIPFITYGYQDVVLDEINTAIEDKYDLLTEKSRTMGNTWMILYAKKWRWLFREYNTFRLFSRNENLVDKFEDPDCLFWKILHILKYLPSFLKPEYNYTHLHIKNLENESTEDGCTTTSDASAGGRCTAMLLDEFALVKDGDGMLTSTRDVTRCRIFNSTHRGAGTAFYRLGEGSIKKVTTHWSLHPLYNPGLYYSVNGKLVLLDTTFKSEVTVTRVKYNFPDNYPFRLDGKLRSPWYDNECDRAAHPMEIAQELDMDPFASDFMYFDDPDLVPRIEKEDVRPPYFEGIVEFDEDSLDPIGFLEGKNGPLKLWIIPDGYGKIPENISIGAGSDISAGTGASNSVISFVNLKTGEKMAEYANPWIKPEAFARLTIALCRFFNNAFLVFDGAGTGRTYGDELISLCFRNLYYRRNEEGLNKKVSDKPGVFLNMKEKKAVLGQYRRALKERTYIQRSHEANQECLSYVYTIGEAIEHSGAANSIDPSGAGDNHGDRVVADSLANKCREFLNGGKDNTENSSADLPKSCYAYHKQEQEQQERENGQW